MKSKFIMKGPFYIGVDVGTNSVRAALVTFKGQIVTMSTKEISIWEPRVDFYEQSSDEIWLAVCKVIRDVSQEFSASEIHGLAFDATASLVVLDKNFQPIAVSEGGMKDHNVIMWMDHRAVEQAKQINGTCHSVLKNVGGKISLEMQLSKLLWLHQNLPEYWKNYDHFFDLADYLTWKATGSLSRSVCSLVCKWSYQADEYSMHWDKTVFHELGLDDLIDEDFRKIGQGAKAVGSPCGQGLTERAAAEMGLLPGTCVAMSIIDAHAGGLGTLGCKPEVYEKVKSNPHQSHTVDGLKTLADVPITSKLALICGTSTCHMIVSEKPVFVEGIWGPYYSAMIPHLWLNEGGQSATGKLLDHIIECHPAGTKVLEDSKIRMMHVHLLLNEVLQSMSERDDVRPLSALTRDFHVWPDYHGNRSPLADPEICGMVSGLRLCTDIGDLAVQYLATMQALVYGTKHIMDTMISAGHSINLVYICGGLANNPLFVQLHADILGLPVVLPETQDSVLLGAAILAATASGDFSNIQEAMDSMSGSGEVLLPCFEGINYHDHKYKVFLNMIKHQKIYRDIMNESLI